MFAVSACGVLVSTPLPTKSRAEVGGAARTLGSGKIEARWHFDHGPVQVKARGSRGANMDLRQPITWALLLQ